MTGTGARVRVPGKKGQRLWSGDLCGLLLVAACTVCWMAGCARAPVKPETKLPPGDEVATVPVPAPPPLMQIPPKESVYRIKPNDILDIRVFQNPEMNTMTRVDDRGVIRFSPLGELQVEGLTERELETRIQDGLRDEFVKEPHVTVFVTEAHPDMVMILGAAAKPGKYPLVHGMRVIDLLSEAGGMTANAGKTAYLFRFEDSTTSTLASTSRAAEPKYTLDLDGLLVRGEKEWNIPLWPGDVVNIPVPEPGWIHVTGLGVMKPGTYPLITFLGWQGREISPAGAETAVPYPLTRSSKTLSQSIDEAGGLKWEASYAIVILRQREDGRQDSLKVNYKAVLADSRNDVPLKTRDTVIVNRRPTKFVLATIGRAAQQIIRIYANWDLLGQNNGG